MTDTEWIHRLAAYRLPGAIGPGAPSGPITDTLDAVAQHKLIGVLAAAVRQGAVPLTDAHRVAVAAAHETAMREVLLLEEMLIDAVEVLGEAGLDHRVLKGSALAQLVCDEPSERSFGDNDLLISPDQIDRAVVALLAAGGTRPVPALSADFDRRFAKSVTMRWHGPSELDLHRTLVAGPYGFLLDIDDLARDPVEFSLAGRALHTLPPAVHLIHGALHVALGDVAARLGNVRDLALLCSISTLDAEAIIAMVSRWGCAAPFAVGLGSTEALGHTPTPLEEWARDHEASPADRRRLAVYGERQDRFRRQARATLSVLGWRDRVAFTRALLWPTAANRAARGRSRRGPGRLPGG